MGALLRVPLFDDELFWSFLSRTARANGSVSPRAFCSDLGLDYFGMVEGQENAFSATAALVGKESAELWRRSTSPAGRMTVLFGGHHYHDGMMRRSPVRYCSECLEVDDHQVDRMPIARRYARISWALECMPVCVRHARKLLPLGASSSLPRWNDLSRVLDTADLTAPRSCMTATRFERFVIERLSGTADHGDLLDGLAIPQCIELCENVGGASLYGRSYGDKRFDLTDRRAIFEAGFDVLSSRSDLLAALLDRLAQAAPAERVGSGEAIYGPLYAALARRPLFYKDIATVVREHAFSRFPRLAPGGFLGDRAERVPVEFTQDTYVSAHGVSRYLYQYEHLTSKTAPIDKATSKADLENAAQVALRHAIGFEKVAALLGCSKYELRGLVMSGIIKPLIGFPDKTGSFKRTDRYIDRQVDLVCEKVTTRANAGGHGSVGIREAVARLGCEPSDVLRHVMLGELRKVSLQFGEPLFRALMVEEAEITDVLGLDGAMGAAAARRELKVDQLTLAWLVRSSAVGGTIDSRTGTIVVRAKDIRVFRRDFITLGELAASRGQPVHMVAKIARAAGIIAVFTAPRARDDIFYRTDVSKAGLEFVDRESDLPGIRWEPLMPMSRARRPRVTSQQRRRLQLSTARLIPLFISSGVHRFRCDCSKYLSSKTKPLPASRLGWLAQMDVSD